MAAFRHICNAVDLRKVFPDIVQHLLHSLRQYRSGRCTELALRKQGQKAEDAGCSGRFPRFPVRFFQFIQKVQQFLSGVPGKMQEVGKIRSLGKGQQGRILGAMDPEAKTLMEGRSLVNADMQFTGTGDNYITLANRIQQVIDQKRHITGYIYLDLIAVMDMGLFRVIRPVHFLLMGKAILKGHGGPGIQLNIL